MIYWFKKHFIPYHRNHHHPHILRHKSLAAALTLVVLLELVMFLGPVVLSRFSAQLAAILPAVVTLLTNDARTENSLAEVKMNDKLTLAAQAKAEDMAKRGYFSHNSPEGVVPWHWLDEARYEYQYAGENLAVNFTDSEQLVAAWQNSPTHNLNLLGSRYTETGVGIATGMYQGRETIFVVQFFASPIQIAKVEVKPQPIVAENNPETETEIEATVSSQPELLSADTQVQPSPSISSPSVWSRIAFSPRTYGTYSLLVLAVLFIAALLIGWGRHHPKALAGGVVMVAVLAGMIVINKFLVFPELKLPTDTQNAASVIFSR